ncbi:CopG family transcriptional regulator [Bifidobacterium pseudolongum]|jgi:hypothetical protein|uniref:CopG family transcriptional regulator n=2 Tax=Bifidobacterium pseudolongum TaxID=1694 RepID=UPI000BBFE8CB|nr:CopG family transcriptional regulator [Bifidobacterium pseudolongum]ASW23443.1 ribbon-helix-helix, copG family protein [Bifidobacterium pseudolongum]
MGEEQVLADERMAEPETDPDDLTGRVHYRLHLALQDERMASVSIRVPRPTLDELTAEARRCHISRNEYMCGKRAVPAGRPEAASIVNVSRGASHAASHDVP